MFEAIITFLQSLTANKIIDGEVKVEDHFETDAEFDTDSVCTYWEVFLKELLYTGSRIEIWKKKTEEERQRDLVEATELEYQSRRNSHDHWYSNSQWNAAQELRKRYALIDVFQVNEVLSDALEVAGIKETDEVTNASLAKIVDAVRVVEAGAEAEAAV